MCLYASDWVKGESDYEVRADYRMISLEDKPKLLDAARGAGRTPTTYQGARDAVGSLHQTRSQRILRDGLC